MEINDFVDLLQSYGVTTNDMWKSAENIIYLDDNEDIDINDIRIKFNDIIEILRRDINVNSIVFAAILLEENCKDGKLHFLPSEIITQDPVHLIADELLGIALSQYISGARGMFNFMHHDRLKPGILSSLGPFADDIVAAIIGGIMSKIFTQIEENK